MFVLSPQRTFCLKNGEPSYFTSFLFRISISVSSLLFSKLEVSSSCFKTLFSFSRYAARNTIWFSFSLLASLDLRVASLFFNLFSQYFSSFSASGTAFFFRFLMIGWGLSSSMSKVLVLDQIQDL